MEEYYDASDFNQGQKPPDWFDFESAGEFASEMPRGYLVHKYVHQVEDCKCNKPVCWHKDSSDLDSDSEGFVTAYSDIDSDKELFENDNLFNYTDNYVDNDDEESGYFSDMDLDDLDDLDEEIILRATSREGSLKDYMVAGLVQGEKIDMTLDCGANKTILSKRFFETLGRKKTRLGKSVRLVGFSRSHTMKGNWITIKLHLGKMITKMDVILADIESDMLIGKDFFDKYVTCLDIRTRTFSSVEFSVPLKEVCFPLSSVSDSNEDTEYPIRYASLHKDVKLPPHQATLVTVSVDCDPEDDTDLCMETVPNSLNVVLPACVISNFPYAQVYLANYTSSSIVLTAGTPVGLLTEVDIITNLDNTENLNSVTIQSLFAEYDGLHPSSELENDEDIKKIIEDMPEHLRSLFTKSLKELTKEQAIEVGELVKEFQDIFAKNYLDVGTYNASKFHIDTGNAEPVKLKYRRTPIHYKEQEKKQLEDLLDRGIIRRSESPWAAAPVLVKKKVYGQDACTQSHIRYCLDYRKLNDATVVPAYPLPNITDLMDFLGSSQWFSTLDCANGYYQIEIDEESIPKTAFACAYGLFEFTVLCYGLKGAPGAFQQAMSIVLNGLIGQMCQAYIDDVTVIGTTFKEHILNLRAVFSRFRQFGMKLKPSKCDLFKTQTDFLGRHITKDGISVNTDQVKIIKEWPRPENVKQLRRFLGFANWLRIFVRDFAADAIPLYALLKKDVVFEWTAEHETSFNSLIIKLSSPPCLAYAQPKGTFQLEVDASKYACGAMLYQWQEYEGQQQLRLVSCFSHVFTPAQTRWCSSRQELLALVKAIREYRVYLLGQKFIAVTDCRVVSFLFSFRDPQGVLARMQEELGCYDFDVCHRKGTLMACPDALSRLPDQLPPCDEYRAGCVPEELPCHTVDKQCQFCQRAYDQWGQFEREVDYVVPLGMSSMSTDRNHMRYFDTEDQLARTVAAPVDQASPQVNFKREVKSADSEIISVKALFDVAEEVRAGLDATLAYGSLVNSTVATSEVEAGLNATLAYHEPVCKDVVSKFASEEPSLHTVHETSELEQDEMDIEYFEEDSGWNIAKDPSPDVDPIFGREVKLKINGEERVETMSENRLTELQEEDKDLGMVIKWLKSTGPTENELAKSSKAVKTYWMCREQLKFVNNVLYYAWLDKSWGNELCLVIPKVLRPFVLYHSHASRGTGHFGRDRLMERMRRSFYWYGMSMEAERYVQTCAVCLKNKKRSRKFRARRVAYSPGYVNQRLHLDIFGPIAPISGQNNRYILTMIDGFSRYVQMAPLTEHTAETVAQAMIDKWISVFGFPMELYTDQGREFQSDLMKVFCRQFEIAKQRTSPYHPQSNSVLERYHSQLGAMLRMYIEASQYKNWDKFLPLLSLAHNTAWNRTTKFSPFELMFGRRCTFPVDYVLRLPSDSRVEKSPVEWVNMVRSHLEKCHEAVRENISDYQVREKKTYDVKAYERKYEIGSYVYKLDSIVTKGISKKLTPVYNGPFLIVKARHPLYTLVTRKNKVVTVHHDRLLAAAPTYIPIELRRQKAMVIASPEASAKETARLYRNQEFREKKKIKLKQSVGLIGGDDSPCPETAAVSRPLQSVEAEVARRIKRIHKQETVLEKIPVLDLNEIDLLDENANLDLIFGEVFQSPVVQTPSTSSEQKEDTGENMLEEEILGDLPYVTRGGRKTTRKKIISV